MKRYALATLLLLTAAAATHAADWPHWRGPARTGISAETEWAAQWDDKGPKVLWKAEVGVGFSTFSVAEGGVFTTGNADEKDTLFCFDAVTGKSLWTHEYPAELGDKYFEGGTTGTPTVAGGRVYQLSRWGDALCLEAATGRVVWSKNVQKETEIRIPDWGYSGSPLVWEDLVILNVGQAGLALKKETGEIVWKSADKNAGYSTPYPFDQGGKKLVVLGSGRSWVAVDPRTGEKAWDCTWSTSYGVNAADPIADGGRLFVSSGYNKGCALLQPGAGEPAKVWENRDMRNMMNPCVLIGGHLYGMDGNNGEGQLKCLELATGKTLWSEKSTGTGSVTAADGKLIVLSEKGELLIAPADPAGFKPAAKAQVLTGKCWTVPVLANGLLYCRNAEGSVVCLDLRKK